MEVKQIMDPITMAVAVALGKLGEKVISDAYTAFKAALQYKCGVNSDLLNAVDELEKKPDSNARIEVLKEEVKLANAEQDPDLVNAANSLIAKVDEISDTKTSSVTQNVTGERNIFSGTGDVNITGKI